MTSFIHQNETDRDQKVRAALEAVLEPGETLLEYTQGKFGSLFAPYDYLIGLTRRRIVLLRKGNAGKAISIQMVYIRSITFDSAKRWSKPTMRIYVRRGFSETAIDVSVPFIPSGYWVPFAENMARQFAAVQASGEPAMQTPDIRQMLSQADDLCRLGLPDLAHEILREEAARNPSLQLDDQVESLMRQVGSDRLAMRVAAVVFGVVILFMVWLAIRGQAMVGFGLVLALIAIFNLLRGNSAARRTALSLASLTAVLNIFSNLIAKSPLDIIVWSAFALSMCLLLIGRPSRLRVGLGGAVFAIGSVGLFVFFMLGVRYFPQAVTWLLPPQQTEPFVENFSAIHKWATSNTEKVSGNIENGAYFMLVKQPNMTYFSFPPIVYSPIRGEVDAWVPEGYSAMALGIYGMVCRYQDNGEKYYIAAVDPFEGGFFLGRVRGEEVVPLVGKGWQLIGGLKDAGQANRIGLSCQDNQVRVTINGIQQAQVNDPDMASFGDGKLGLVVATNDEMPDQGFKVLFDNAAFWPAGN